MLTMLFLTKKQPLAKLNQLLSLVQTLVIKHKICYLRFKVHMRGKNIGQKT